MRFRLDGGRLIERHQRRSAPDLTASQTRFERRAFGTATVLRNFLLAKGHGRGSVRIANALKLAAASVLGKDLWRGRGRGAKLRGAPGDGGGAKGEPPCAAICFAFLVFTAQGVSAQAPLPGGRQAPIGHRQPTLGDLPPDVRKEEEPGAKPGPTTQPEAQSQPKQRQSRSRQQSARVPRRRRPARPAGRAELRGRRPRSGGAWPEQGSMPCRR